MIQFSLGLIVLTPIGLVSGVFGLAWAWEAFSGCFLSLSYYCGQVQWLKALFFLVISGASFFTIKELWDRTK